MGYGLPIPCLAFFASDHWLASSFLFRRSSDAADIVRRKLSVTISCRQVSRCENELERADSGLRSWALVQGALAIQAIHSFGTPEPHARWLPGPIWGERVGVSH
jgi:hypothetical protein